MYKVCFADDEPFIFRVLEAMVDWSAYNCRIAGTATDGVEALELYEKEKPDLFFVDIKMPLMDGLTCIRHLREKDQTLKIILLTASDSFEYAQEAINLGANGYLLKPVGREVIHKMISKVIGELDQHSAEKAEQADHAHPFYESRNQAGQKELIIKANTYALENYHDPHLSLESAAEHVGLSKNYFIRFYGKETGISFWTHITNLRIDRAMLLLRSTELSVVDICARVGYDDVSYFSRKFKQEVGMSPRRYRLSNGGNRG